MDERGLWELFFATGLPEVYLALAGRDQEKAAEPALTAFRPRIQEV